MITMMKINKIWQDLEKDTSISQGLLLRMYSASVIPDVYAAMQYPEKVLCLCISISQSIEVNINQFSNLQEIEVSLFASPNEKDKKLLLFKLLNVLHRDIFAVLCEDLI